jgi:N-acetylglutamate synthase-like GNAT family acetyltransferase
MVLAGEVNMYSSTEEMDSKNRVIRPLRHSDFESICELSKSIWEGNDYLPSVFHEWVDAPGAFVCIEDLTKHCIIATGKYSYQSDGTGLLEGLRVHEAYRGQHVSMHICKAIFEKAWEDREKGIITNIVNCTHRSNAASLHISSKIGFTIQQRFLIVESPPTAVYSQPLVIETWNPTYEECIQLPYFSLTQGYLAQNFMVQRATPSLFKTLIKTAHFAKINGCPGFYDNNHGWYNVSLDPSPRSIHEWIVYANRQPNVKESLAFVPPTPSIVEGLKQMPIETWENFEPDLLYLVYTSDKKPL